MRYCSLQPHLVNIRLVLVTREGTSRVVHLGLRLLIVLFIVVITLVLVITLFFDLVPKDQEMVNSTILMELPVILEVILLWWSTATIEFKYLTRLANSCSNLGQREVEMVNFPILVVSLLTRGTTKLLLLTTAITESKYLMRRVYLFVPLVPKEVVMVN